MPATFSQRTKECKYQHIVKIIDDYSWLQHITIPTHKPRWSARFGHHCTQNHEVSTTHVDDLKISDHYLVTTSLVATKLCPTCELFTYCNIKNVKLNEFRARLIGIRNLHGFEDEHL